MPAKLRNKFILIIFVLSLICTYRLINQPKFYDASDWPVFIGLEDSFSFSYPASYSVSHGDGGDGYKHVNGFGDGGDIYVRTLENLNYIDGKEYKVSCSKDASYSDDQGSSFYHIDGSSCKRKSINGITYLSEKAYPLEDIGDLPLALIKISIDSYFLYFEVYGEFDEKIINTIIRTLKIKKD